MVSNSWFEPSAGQVGGADVYSELSVFQLQFVALPLGGRQRLPLF